DPHVASQRARFARAGADRFGPCYVALTLGEQLRPASPHPPFSRLEEPDERREVGYAGFDVQCVDPAPLKELRELLAFFLRVLPEALANFPPPRVQLYELSGLRVFERDQPDVWQLLLATIMDVKRDEIVARAGQHECVFQLTELHRPISDGLEIAHQEHNRSLP